MKPTEDFSNQVRRVWGKPRHVADVAFNELFAHEDGLGLDHGQQVFYAKQIGVLAGTMKNTTPAEFILAFTDQVLNN